jgi:hypothetical protein
VLKGEGHLNADQVFDAAQFLELSDDEYRFVSLLHEYERAVSAPRRKRLEGEIEAARLLGLKTDDYVDASPLASTATPATVALYLNPNAPLVHMFFTVKRFRADPEKVRRTLGLDPSAFADAVQCCERAGLIRSAGKRIEMLRDNIHLPASSPLFTAYRSALRHKGAEFIHTHGKSRHYSFVALYSASEETRSRVQSRFLEFVSWVQTLTQGTEAAHVYQLSFDLLRWSEE